MPHPEAVARRQQANRKSTTVLMFLVSLKCA
jgi:hypothetical protein